MADIYGDRVEKHRDEGIEIARIEGDRKEKEKFKHLRSPETKQAMLATFITSVKTFFALLEPTKEFEGKWIELEEIREGLKKLKEKLELLRREDVSESSEFAEELSLIWEKLSKNLTQLELLPGKESKRLEKKEENPFRALIKAIETYPEGVEQSLGYYLEKHPGKTWLPFPFIALLRQLHLESLKASSENSKEKGHDTLTLWIEMIDEILSFLTRKYFQP